MLFFSAVVFASLRLCFMRGCFCSFRVGFFGVFMFFVCLLFSFFFFVLVFCCLGYAGGGVYDDAALVDGECEYEGF